MDSKQGKAQKAVMKMPDEACSLTIKLRGYQPFEARFTLTGWRRDEYGLPVNSTPFPIEEAARRGILKDKIIEFVDMMCADLLAGKGKKE